MPELEWSGNDRYLEVKRDWKTPEILIEGSLNCAKTTLGLDKEIDALLKWPGIPILIFRWTEDALTTKLKPAFEELLSIRGLTADWDAKQKVYTFPNGSKAWMFGLKAVSAIEMFNKIRGLGVCRILGDQVEEMDRAVAGDLRGRLRPNLTATMTGNRYPFQLTFIANCEDHDFWLSKEFPLDNRIVGRKVFSFSIFDNYHLPQESRESLLRQYPPDHPKNLTMIMGQRGPSVVGDPVFEGVYNKELHHGKPIALRPDLPIYESFECGKHNPTWVFAQPIYGGGLAILGGIRGEEMLMDDFVSVVQDYRERWYDGHGLIKTCIAPMGETQSTATRANVTDILKRDLDVQPRCNPDGNAPDVRLAAIEHLGVLLRHRSPNGSESFLINTDETKFLIVNKEGPRESAFVHHALEAGYIWDDHFVSVSNKELRRPKEDDKFANAMHCIENIYLNFCMAPPKRPQTRTVGPRRKADGPMSWAG